MVNLASLELELLRFIEKTEETICTLGHEEVTGCGMS